MKRSALVMLLIVLQLGCMHARETRSTTYLVGTPADTRLNLISADNAVAEINSFARGRAGPLSADLGRQAGNPRFERAA